MSSSRSVLVIIFLIVCLKSPGSNRTARAAEANHGTIAPYQWEKDGFYTLTTTITLEQNSEKRRLDGTVLYRLDSVTEGRAGNVVVEESEGSGTGFLISPDGYLVTCHHVIEDATGITVHLVGRNLPATVVGSDAATDLAVLKVAASKLPYLALAYDSDVEPGMELRAFGYPLTAVLGESVKVTRGSLAGVAEYGEQRFYQIDASINPGNSGGPIVSEKGEVVGVASASLSGRGISTVDLAIPGSQAEPLCCKHLVPFFTGGATQRLDGPELVRRVSPAVALVKTKTRSSVSIGSRRFTLKIFHRYVMNRAIDGSYAHFVRDFFPPLPNQSAEGILVFDDFGNVLEQRGDTSMAVSVGLVGPLDVDPIPNPCPNTWNTKNERLLSIGKTDGKESWSGSARKIEAVILVPATERCTYRVVQATPAELVLEKSYELATPDGPDGPMLKITGKGTVTIPRKPGGVKTSRMTGSISINADGEKDEIALELESKTTFHSKDKKPENGTPKTPEEEHAQDQAANEELDKCLEKLEEGSRRPYGAILPLGQLGRMKPIESRRTEVIRAVEPYLDSDQSMLQRQAVDVVGSWGTQENVDSLIRLLVIDDRVLRDPVIKALGKLGGAKAAEAVAPMLASIYDSMSAQDALEEMGAVAEPAVLKLLNNTDSDVRMNACSVLGKIGGEKSYQALVRIFRTDRDSLVRSRAQTAITEIQRRHR